MPDDVVPSPATNTRVTAGAVARMTIGGVTTVDTVGVAIYPASGEAVAGTVVTEACATTTGAAATTTGCGAATY
jgi:hypothetical protein